MDQHLANPDRLDELLADRATQVLSTEETDELTALLADAPACDEEAFDRVAAALDLPAIARAYEPMPASVRERLEAGAVTWLAKRRGS